ncbi:SCP2 sterol-binding domain-containing protein [Anaerocolumna xylanovorans]|uniref:SCP-2 sterol transfer family protein n=1 Tax=Anaerocolumna xylanovorans DSM 12503 TaxID=1121345 RepID=A0A1M7YMG8_9FIRM|nr:SCP2 sterol-binding domain-containing protein [Anaerocolumna xylanovorans]SHO53851.1 SCP-2 sterol transfer family protein [Anaerocolumna xylanovorans DSM 12503]
MKINIYYGGRGLIEDPTIYVIHKLTEVLEELRVNVTRYNLYEEKNGIAMLPKTLKEADGIILAVNVEWLGIGGFMQQFLDACWLYADKEHIGKLYMLPVVMAIAGGEREAESYLVRSWEILGGIALDGIRAYVEDRVDFETNQTYGLMIEKYAERLYKAVNQKAKMLPGSNFYMKKQLLKGSINDLTPQESEQLSMYVSDDTYVKKQKEDIEELAQIFKGMLTSKEEEGEDILPKIIENYRSIKDLEAVYEIGFTDSDKTIIAEISKGKLNCFYGKGTGNADVEVKMSFSVMERVLSGNITMQMAFMSGELTAKGNFSLLRSFDEAFPFKKI